MTEDRRGAVLTAGSNVSGIRLVSAADATLKALSSGKGPRVFVVLPAGSREAHTAYLERHAAGAHELAEWGARLVVVVTGTLEEAKAVVPAGLVAHAEVFADPRGVIGLRAPAVLVADEWGEVFFTSSADRVEDLPGPEDLRDWAVFVAIQCPECEGPEGGWKTL